MTIRVATAGDLPVLERMWRAFEEEIPEPPWVDVDLAGELRELAEIVAGEIALVAEAADGSILGFVLARRAGTRLGRITDVYVVPEARGRSASTALVREAVEALRVLGVDTVRLEVVAGNAHARAIYARWGFREEELTLVAPLDELARRLAPESAAASAGVVYVQTDDRVAVGRAATAFAPRIGSPGSQIDEPANGWIAVRDDVASGEPQKLRRLGKEMSDRLGAVVILLGVESGAVVRMVAYERGSIMDEYLSVPEFHGPLVPGDVVALAANPTVLARLTGGDAAAIRAAAPSAASTAELPGAAEIVARLATALGLPDFNR